MDDLKETDQVDSNQYGNDDAEEENVQGTAESRVREQRDQDDKKLVALSQRGDKAAFEKLVRMYSKYVYTNAFFMLRDTHEAEDVSQEVFVKVYLLSLIHISEPTRPY